MIIVDEYTFLQELLACRGEEDPVLNPAELKGFLFGQVITPEDFQPQECLPLILGDQRTASVDIQLRDRLLDSLLGMYNRFDSLRCDGRLQFPYCLKLPSEETVNDALDWAFGFNLALEMRPEIWFGNGPVQDAADYSNESLSASFSVVRGIAWPDEAEELFAEEEGTCLAGDECDLLAILLVALPEAVSVIQEYALRLDSRPVRIGRHEPCPCGSNKKYMECCSDNRISRH